MGAQDEYADLLGQPLPKQSDSLEGSIGKYDLGGNLLFDYGGGALNNAIDRRNAKLQKIKSQITSEQYNRLKAAVSSNSADWDKLTKSILGADGEKLNDFYQGVEASDQSNLDAYKGAMGDYSKVEDLFSNPNFYGDVGDVSNAAKPTDATVQEQRGMLAKMKSLSDPTETAAERFQRLMAQKTADANMKGARDSIAENLKARGVYGSGAEVVQNMMSQADEANRRYMANLAADAQAQQRATQMLGMGSDLATKMRGAETQEGALANQVNMFNNQVNQNLMNTKSGAQVAGRQFDTGEQGRRATSTLQAETGLNTNLRGDLGAKNSATIGLTQGEIANRNAGTGMLNDADKVFTDDIDKDIAGNIARKSTGGLIASM
jgi:hypothetical protein